MEFKDSKYNYDNVIEVRDQSEVGSRKFLSGVFSWMFVALAISGVSAFLFAGTPALRSLLFDFNTGHLTGLGMIVRFLPLAFILLMSFGLNRLSYPVLAFLFIAYSAATGVSLSFLLLIYSSSSVSLAFGVSALVFGVMAIAGYTTQMDLTNFGGILIMLLIGIIIASLVNMFLNSEAMGYIISYFGVAVFTGLTAYDVQKLKRIGAGLEYGDASAKKMALMGGLTLYLDFINLFLFVLRLFGGRRR
jgi:FtsH-binding integral membrane protein